MWAIRILLAVAFGAAGAMKLVRSQAHLAANPHMGWVHSVPEDRIKLVGVSEVLGAIGLVVPMAIGIAPILTRVSAVCPATLLGRAAATHKAWRVRGSLNDPRRVGDCGGSVAMIVTVESRALRGEVEKKICSLPLLGTVYT